MALGTTVAMEVEEKDAAAMLSATLLRVMVRKRVKRSADQRVSVRFATRKKGGRDSKDAPSGGGADQMVPLCYSEV